MFEPNVFGCLPSSELKNDDRPHVHMYHVIPDGKSLETYEITCLFKLGRNCWIISPSTILRLWNVCAGGERMRWIFPQVFFEVQRCEQDSNAPPGRVLPYVTLTGTCGPIGYGFRRVLS